eukprot:EW704866.1.p1 GENE.EW704866.1~~EW704866.1.p1  ORF type:complete len:132 (+),score=45.61 EW704866.1:75-470(+)
MSSTQSMRNAKKLGAIGQLESEVRYLTLVKQNKLYGSTFFPGVEVISRERKEEVILGVSENGLSFIHPITRQPVKKAFRLDELVEVEFKEGVFVSTFSFSAGQFLQKKTFTFESKQARQIKELINSYLEDD